MQPLAKHIRKLGYNKGIRRLWIEGADLRCAGFVAKETHYIRTYDGETLTLYLDAITADTIIPSCPYKVSGKGDNPIIDITGTDLADFFDGVDQVEVSFFPNEIRIARCSNE